MNILFISFGLDPTVGGTERVTRTLMENFEHQGMSSYITFCFGDDSSFPKEKKLKINYRGSYSVFKKAMDNFIAEHDINLIINENVCEWNVSRYFGNLKAIHSKMPIIYCLHNTPDLFVPHYTKVDAQTIKNVIYRWFTGCTIYMAKHKRMYDIVDRYVVLSPSYISRFYEIFGMQDNGKVIAIPNPITMAKPEDELPEKENLFLVVARLTETQKNIRAILRIWKEFCKQNKDYQLQIVGYGPDEKLLRDYAASLQLQNVSFMGRTHEPQKFYRRAKFFLMTSRYEGFPMTIIESMLFGCIPIVFNSFAAISDVIDNGKNGILIPNNDENAFLHAMLDVAGNRQQQEKISKQVAPSLAKFSEEKVTSMWMNLFGRFVDR